MANTHNSTTELSWHAIILGLILSVVMGAANVYLGLKVGMTVSASIPAAVIAMVFLRGVLKRGSILESNQVQTAASAGESLAAGIIFTMPALLLIGYWQEFDMLMTTVVALTGGLLGILFMIPMRRVFVVGNNPELKYPEGIACAAVLKAGESSQDADGAKPIINGALVGLAFKLLASFFAVIKGSLEGALSMGGRVVYLGGDVSPALVAVGMIVGLNVSILIFIGGAFAWLIEIPILSGIYPWEGEALDAAWTIWSQQVRYTGVGAMVVGGIASIYKVRYGLSQAVQELRSATSKVRNPEQTSDQDRDLPAWAINLFSAIAIALVGMIYYKLTGQLLIAIITTVTMIIMSFFFTAVASYIVGLVGNSNSPVSGMTITAVLFTGGLLYIFGYSGMEGMVATLGVAAVVCCAACTSGDVCNDLKTGAIVGATPFKQQTMQILGVLVASLVMAPVLQLLHDYTPGGIGGRELAAPQAALFASLAKGFFGDGKIPWDLVSVGVAIGIAILIADHQLANRKSNFRLHLMPIAVGMYLPFGLAIPMVIGGLMTHFITKGKSEHEAETASRKGVLFSSGIIAGESLMGVGLALFASLGIQAQTLVKDDATKTLLTWVAIGIGLFIFWKSSHPKNSAHQ